MCPQTSSQSRSCQCRAVTHHLDVSDLCSVLVHYRRLVFEHHPKSSCSAHCLPLVASEQSFRLKGLGLRSHLQKLLRGEDSLMCVPKGTHRTTVKKKKSFTCFCASGFFPGSMHNQLTFHFGLLKHCSVHLQMCCKYMYNVQSTCDQ